MYDNTVFNSVEDIKQHIIKHWRTADYRWTCDWSYGVSGKGDKVYSLRHSSGTWSHDYIRLSEKLGVAIDKAWAKRPAYRGSTHLRNAGGLTLVSILKKLGVDVAPIKAEIARKSVAEAEESAKNVRNYDRSEVERMAKAIQRIIERSAWTEWPTQLALLAEVTKYNEQ